jgi:hypothetical protein
MATTTHRHGAGRILLLALVALALLAVAWTWFTLHWAYSDGDRAGVLQKLSRKGWICKTWEGELALYVVGGVAPEIWHFSVRDQDAVTSLRHALGQRVRLHYSEHRMIPTSCFGDTRYFVDDVEELNASGIYELAPGT